MVWLYKNISHCENSFESLKVQKYFLTKTYINQICLKESILIFNLQKQLSDLKSSGKCRKLISKISSSYVNEKKICKFASPEITDVFKSYFSNMKNLLKIPRLTSNKSYI